MDPPTLFLLVVGGFFDQVIPLYSREWLMTLVYRFIDRGSWFWRREV